MGRPRGHGPGRERTTVSRDTRRRRAAVIQERSDKVPHPSRILAVSTGAGDSRDLMLQQLLLLLQSPPPRGRATEVQSDLGIDERDDRAVTL